MPTRERIVAGDAGARAGAWVMAFLLVLSLPCALLSQNGLPNLRPYQPEGWSDAIVVSNRQEDNVDTLGLKASDRLYVDFAVINDGGSRLTEPFRIDLYLDGRLRKSFDVEPPLDPRAYRFREDYVIRRLGPGLHTLRIVADAGESVSESDESDNEYTRTFRVSGDCFPLTTRVTPRAAGTLTANRELNCGSVRIGIPEAGDGNTGRELGTGGEPVTEARKARSVAVLRNRVRSEGRVKVIVGLKNEVGSAPAVLGSLAVAKARAPEIARFQRSLSIRMSGHNVSSLRRFKFIPYVAMEVDGAALEVLASDPEVVSIEEDGVVKPVLADSTARIGAPHAWDQGYSGEGQTIVVLDTGVDGNHPFLAGKVVSEACFSESFCAGGVSESVGPGSGMPCPSSLSDCFHGTAVAGIAAGRGPDFSGVAREARIIAIQVFSQCGEDCIDSRDSAWIQGLERVLELSAGFDIAAVNLSFGRLVADPENCDSKSPAAKAAMDNLRAAGIAPIVASGNAGSPTGIDFPACISSAVSVGSTGDGGDEVAEEAVSELSNSSPSLDLLAPGSSITTSTPEGEFGAYSGTSLAAPHVGGAWAVLKSKAPHASVAELLSVLQTTGIPISDPRNDLVKPRIQVDAALARIVEELPYSSGTHLTLTARPNPGFRFKSWRGCDSPSGNRCVVEMDSVHNVTAFFEPSAASLPDLITTSLTGPPTGTVGSEVSISASIRNQGPANAGPFRLGLYLSTDASITIDDTWFAACTYEAGLPAGESATCDRSFPIPPRVSPGRYFLGAIVDDLDRVVENSETNNALAADSGALDVLAPTKTFWSFVPVVLSSRGRNNSFFTSELTLTNRGSREARLDYTYTAHRGGGSGTASDSLAPGQQRVESDALGYLKRLGVPIPDTGDRIGTLAVKSLATAEVGVVVRTTTDVTDGRAGLAYPGIAEEGGFEAAVYLCGLRQNGQDRSNVAFQNMGAAGEGPITLRTTAFSGDRADSNIRVLEDVTLDPGGFHQYSGVLVVLGRPAQGYVKVERIEGTAPFYAYGVINDQANSDGSFVFPVTAGSFTGITEQVLPVIVKIRDFASELTVTNFSEAAKTVILHFGAEGVRPDDHTATYTLTLEAGEQQIIPDIVEEMRRQGVSGIGATGRVLAGAVFSTVESGDMSGIVIGARTGAPGGGGNYSVFYNAVPAGSAFSQAAWIDGLQQNQENRSNLALVNTGDVDASESVFSLDIYDGETGLLAGTVTTKPIPVRGWHQIGSILRNHTRGTRQGYVRIRRILGNNSFLAYGVVNDGGAPGERSGDGSFLPARE